MSVTVQTIVTQVEFALLEDGAFVLGRITQQQVLDILGIVILDFVQRAQLFWNIFTQRQVTGTSVYTVPDNVLRADSCFVAGRLMEKVTEEDLAYGVNKWRNVNDTPRQFHEDNLPPKSFETFPKPIATGAVDGGTYGKFLPAENNLTIVGPAAPNQTTWAITDTLQSIPDPFTNYLVYGILEQVFSGENELRDMQRAAYCRTRFNEGIALAIAIVNEDLYMNGD